MNYWDSSALVPLLVDEEMTGRVRNVLADDPTVVTWALSRVEIVSALERRVREGVVTRAERRELLDRFTALFEATDEVADIAAVRSHAERLLAVHPLRAADAIQLAAARVLAEGGAVGLGFVCLDARLSEAAEKEGFRVLPKA